MKNEDLATVIGLITGRAEALADGNVPMAREYQRLIGKMNVGLDMPDVDPQTANAALVMFKSTFDPKQVASAKRVSVVPNVPTYAEAGYPFEASSWVGIFAPPARKNRPAAEAGGPGRARQA